MKGERHVGGEIRVLSNLIKRCMDAVSYTHLMNHGISAMLAGPTPG